jgi:hypothetical protein
VTCKFSKLKTWSLITKIGGIETRRACRSKYKSSSMGDSTVNTFELRQDQRSDMVERVLKQMRAATIETVASSSKSLIDRRVNIQVNNTSSLIRSTFNLVYEKVAFVLNERLKNKEWIAVDLKVNHF